MNDVNRKDGEFKLLAEGLWKKVVKAGDGDPVPAQALVTVHYVGTLDDESNKQFDSSRDRGEPFEFQLGRGHVIRGWDEALAGMTRGERAQVKCSPAMAYGAHGSPPDIPPEATLLFDIELLEWRPADRSRSEMSTDELVAGALGDKERGNALFKQGNYLGALQRYDDALGWLKHVYQEREKARPVELSLHLNRSASHLRVDAFRDALTAVQEALRVDRQCAKAYWRRAQAHQGLGLLDAAKDDLVQAIKLEPKNRQFRADYARIQDAIKKAAATEKSMFKSMFSDESIYNDHAPEKAKRPVVFLDVEVDGGSSRQRLEFELFSDVVPRTAENFRCLCTGERGLGPKSKQPLTFKGSPFHRLVAGFAAQGGDFTHGNGQGGESVFGGTFRDEAAGLKLSHDRPFMLSMANVGPDSNGSQFLCTFAPATHLDGKHVVFGELSKQSATFADQQRFLLETIQKVPVDEQNKPLQSILITDCGQLKL